MFSGHTILFTFFGKIIENMKVIDRLSHVETKTIKKMYTNVGYVTRKVWTSGGWCEDLATFMKRESGNPFRGKQIPASRI